MKTIGREEGRLILLRNNDPNVWMRQPGERERDRRYRNAAFVVVCLLISLQQDKHEI